MLCIYNPFVLPTQTDTIEFVLGYGNSVSIGIGTKIFMQGLIRDIGKKAEVLNWKMMPFRSKYYSQYPDSDDWRDRWVLKWIVKVQLAKNLRPLSKLDHPIIYSEAFDSTWTSVKRPDGDTPLDCIVISDFETKFQLEQSKKRIERFLISDEMQEFQDKYSLSPPIYSNNMVLGKYFQLQINLGEFPGSFYAEGANYAEEIMKLCVKSDGTLNFLDRLYPR